MVPLILLSGESSQSRSARALETGTEEKTVSSSCPSSKVKPIFFVPRPAYTENTDCLTVMTSLDTLLVCSGDGHTKLFSQSQKRLMILRYQGDYAKEGSRPCFFVVYIWNLFFQNNFILNTRPSVQPGKHGTSWP